MGCIAFKNKQSESTSDDVPNIELSMDNTPPVIITKPKLNLKSTPNQEQYNLTNVRFGSKLCKQLGSTIYTCRYNNTNCIAKVFTIDNTFDNEYNNLVNLGESDHIVKFYGKLVLPNKSVSLISNSPTTKKISKSASYDVLNDNVNDLPTNEPSTYNVLIFERAICDLNTFVTKNLDNNIEESTINNNQYRLLRHYAAIHIGIQVGHLLKYLHNKNYAHLDVKLQNILVFKVDGTIKLKLCDMAYATNVTLCESAGGSPFYVAPEIINAKNCPEEHLQFDPKICDIYSFGIMLYYILHGYYPNYKATDGYKELLTKRITKDVICDSHIDNRLAMIIQGMTNRVPEERYSLDEILKDLQSLWEDFSLCNLDIVTRYNNLSK